MSATALLISIQVKLDLAPSFLEQADIDTLASSGESSAFSIYAERVTKPAAAKCHLNQLLELVSAESLAKLSLQDLKSLTDYWLENFGNHLFNDNSSENATKQLILKPSKIYGLFTRSGWVVGTARPLSLYQLPVYRGDGEIGYSLQGFVPVSSQAAKIYKRLRSEWLNRGVGSLKNRQEYAFYTRTFTQDTAETRRLARRPEVWLAAAVGGVLAYFLGAPILGIILAAALGFMIGWAFSKLVNKVQHVVESKRGSEACCLFKQQSKLAKGQVVQMEPIGGDM